jgi:NH3-dependent NAD+ synthetase
MMLEDLLIRARVALSDAPTLYVPVSGGSDSALVFWLCNQIKPNATIGLHAVKHTYPPLPKDDLGIKCADWFQGVGEVRKIELEWFSEENRWANFLARAQGKFHYYQKGWLVGCTNKTELTLGTYSLASRVAPILPIASIWKSDVVRLCQAIGVPEIILEGSRHADLDCGRPEQMAEIPFEIVDSFCKQPEIKSEMLTEAQYSYLVEVYNSNLWKNDLPRVI